LVRPTDEGLRAAEPIREEDPHLGVLMLSQHLEPSYATRLLETHPEQPDYLLKEWVFAPSVLADGETVVDPNIVSTLFGRCRRRDPLSRSAHASARCCRWGPREQAIAERGSTSPSTPSMPT
jgi:DNA-binding NarL/FixJ family response regulator